MESAQYTPADANSPVPPPQPPSSSGKTALIVIGVVTGVLVVGIAVCCGGPFALAGWGLSVAKAEVEEDLRYNVFVRRHLGELESIEWNFEKSGQQGEEMLAFDVVGSKAKGTVHVRFADGDGAEMEEAVLELETGETMKIFPYETTAGTE